jgi:hypothetical protein
LDFLAHSDEQFAAGDNLQGSEKLWGAASHAVTALAKERGWPFDKHRARYAAINRLADELNEPVLSSNFLIARHFHDNFYRDFMEDDDIGEARPKVYALVHRIVALARGA